jgi:predicted nucleic acid-binding protein
VIVVDSSIALQWVLPEEATEQAERYLSEPDIGAPDVLFVEAANVLAKKVRLRDLSGDEARRAFALIEEAFTRVESTRRLIPRALELAITRSHPAYDCVFLACAEALEAKLATRDAPFVKRIRERGFDQLPAELPA